MLRWQQGWSRLLWSISGRLLLVMLLISLLPMGMVVLYNQTESNVCVGVILISLIVAPSITKPIRTLVSAAHALKHDQFNQLDPRVLRHYAQGSDDMAELAQVFLDMAQAVEQRQDQLEEELSELKIEIDQEKRKKSVAEITSTDYFQKLHQRAQQLRQRAHTKSPTPATHPQIGHTEGEARKDEPPLPT
ncbi:HAMP domain-containing protein [Thermosynechococcus sp. HY213]|uniref:HAMP domain-containing protein n=1 Tax=unclassified Thermosynechococcus TaxID=2622553 RepID=UPI00122E3698|nr:MULTISPECIES: HAMP domain-containing protein [unclassified Thermosynechococcus]MDR7922818.1 HAMP domain-containing protein [Thermosynechococcus sp. HY213]QEQ00947.1 HAMP domain-containing protein [Thermosynechococcus sp. CL-1]WKT84852.1 HAMP domain-containing protein [Thermosynechococcus sp. HY596]WNC63986.1 HAMP domain-containing protein [Thermosynechococcus sp. HY591]WNC66550.1 HAMP domain-containing protein [Thermosynechococcus sp. HY593]